MSKSNKKPLIALAVVALVGIIGGTFAYFTTTTTLNNKFQAATYKTTTSETFTSPTNWTPGTDTPKTVTTKNEGSVDVAVRVKLTPSWTSSTGGTLGTTFGSSPAQDIAVINFSSGNDWSEKQADGYYYYMHKLAPGATTASSLISSVKFNDDFVVGETCVKAEDATAVNCTTKTNEDYSGATYRLVVVVETIQFDAYQTAWTGAPSTIN